MSKTKELFIEMRLTIEKYVNQVIEGEINPFELGRELCYTKNCIEEAKEKISDYEKKEIEKYSKDELLKMKISLRGGGVQWKFDHIPEWKSKKEELTSIEDSAKMAYKTLNNNITCFDKKDGFEIIAAICNNKKNSVSYGI